MSKGGVVDYANAGYITDGEAAAEAEAAATPKPRAGEHVERWRVGQPRDSSGVRFIEEGGLATIGKIYDEVDAQRIVACVNACEGMLTENLEGTSMDQIYRQLREERDLLREREKELVDALQTLQSSANCHLGKGGIMLPLEAAILHAGDVLAKHGR